jgi:hypothetical protein
MNDGVTRQQRAAPPAQLSADATRRDGRRDDARAGVDRPVDATCGGWPRARRTQASVARRTTPPNRARAARAGVEREGDAAAAAACVWRRRRTRARAGRRGTRARVGAPRVSGGRDAGGGPGMPACLPSPLAPARAHVLLVHMLRARGGWGCIRACIDRSSLAWRWFSSFACLYPRDRARIENLRSSVSKDTSPTFDILILPPFYSLRPNILKPKIV